jgi:hypothetical protein
VAFLRGQATGNIEAEITVMLRRTLLVSALAAASPAAWAQSAAPGGATATAQTEQPELQTFTPSNALEQTFIAALSNAAMRPAFRRQFLESHVLLVTASNAADAPPLLRQLRGDDRAALIFTSAALMEQRLGPETPHVSLTGRAALLRLRQNHVVINFGYAPMLMLDPPGVAGFLDIPATPESAGPAQ